MAGYFRVGRGYREIKALQDPRPWRRPDAWVWMLEQAEFSGPNQGILTTTAAALAETWGWSRQAVYRFLENLESANEINALGRFSETSKNRTNSGQTPDNDRTWSSRGTFVISICNYSDFVAPKAIRKDDTGQTADNQRTNPGLPYIESKKEEDKKGRKSTHPSGESATGDDERQDSLFPTANVVVLKTDQEQVAFDAYNAMAARCDLRLCRSLSPERRASLRQRLREVGGIDGWMIALDKVSESKFIRSWRTTGWASFGLHSLLQKETLARLMDDAYSSNKSANGVAETNNERSVREYREAHGGDSFYHEILSNGNRRP